VAELVGEEVTGAIELSFQDTLNLASGRFDVITLEDRNLPVIAHERLLKPMSDEAAAAIAGTLRVPAPAPEGGMDDHAKNVALLAAQIATYHPTLPHALCGSVARVCHFAGRLEAELRTYGPLEVILNSAVHCVEDRTGWQVDEELLMALLDRFGVNDARRAVERIRQMDLDSLTPA
jgi:hypothetical protein